MSTEVITGNDLKAILNEVLPPTASEYRKLLWTNPSPASAFLAQTINFDLSDYDEIELFIAGNSASHNASTQSFKLIIGKGGLLSISANVIWWRYVTPTVNGIEFGTAYQTPTYGANGTTNNELMVPYKIYGIKYERVAPPLADMEWKEAGRTTSTSDWIDLPATAKEVNLIAVVGGTIYSGYRSLAEPITSVTTWMFGGYYAGTSDFGYANVNMRNNGRSFQKRHFFYAGTSYDSAATLIVYYR